MKLDVGSIITRPSGIVSRGDPGTDEGLNIDRMQCVQAVPQRRGDEAVRQREALRSLRGGAGRKEKIVEGQSCASAREAEPGEELVGVEAAQGCRRAGDDGPGQDIATYGAHAADHCAAPDAHSLMQRSVAAENGAWLQFHMPGYADAIRNDAVVSDE